MDYILTNKKVILNLPIRYGKTHISISSILNGKGSSIFFVDRNMIHTFEKTLKEDYKCNNIAIYHGKNKDALKELDSNNESIIISTEETFSKRYLTLSPEEKKNLKLIRNIAFDEFHSFMKVKNKTFKIFQGVFKECFSNIDLLILLSASPTNEKIHNIFKSLNLIDKNFVPSH